MSTVSQIFQNPDFEQISSDSIFEFLKNSEDPPIGDDEGIDENSLFDEISRLAEESNPNDTRSVAEIIEEAESLIQVSSDKKTDIKCFEKHFVRPDSVISHISDISTPKLVGDTTLTAGGTENYNYDTEADVWTLKDEENDDSVSFLAPY